MSSWWKPQSARTSWLYHLSVLTVLSGTTMFVRMLATFEVNTLGTYRSRVPTAAAGETSLPAQLPEVAEAAPLVPEEFVGLRSGPGALHPAPRMLCRPEPEGRGLARVR